MPLENLPNDSALTACKKLLPSAPPRTSSRTPSSILGKSRLKGRNMEFVESSRQRIGNPRSRSIPRYVFSSGVVAWACTTAL